MIHLALVILAVWVIYKAGSFAIVFIADAFDQNWGCGCLSLIVVIVIAVIALAVGC